MHFFLKKNAKIFASVNYMLYICSRNKKQTAPGGFPAPFKLRAGRVLGTVKAFGPTKRKTKRKTKKPRRAGCPATLIFFKI